FSSKETISNQPLVISGELSGSFRF
ncbi:hypothetical protein CP061683_0889B, partial [Chlamydia psittaci 06-1683]